MAQLMGHNEVSAVICTGVANNSLAAIVILADVLPPQLRSWFAKTNDSVMS